MVEKEPRTTAKEIQAKLQTQGRSFCDRTICRFSSKSGLYGRRPSLLKEKDLKISRLEFVKIHIDKPQSFWENALWTDDIKLELFGKSHQFYVHR